MGTVEKLRNYKPGKEELDLGIMANDGGVVQEAIELDRWMKRDGRFPSLASFSVLFESLVALKQFQIALELFLDVVGLGI